MYVPLFCAMSRLRLPLGPAALLLALLLMVPAAHAQQARTITFNEAVQISLDQNIELRQARNDVNVQASTVLRERGDFLPNLNLSANPSRSFGLSFDQTAGRLVNTTSDFISFNVGSSVTLFDGFANRATLNRARHNLEVNNLTVDRQEQTVLFNVIQNYLQVLLDQERIRIREEDVEAQQQQLTRIEEFTRVGTRPISDLYQQQATLASSELQLLESERALQISTTRLVQVLELDPLGDYTFEAPTIDDAQLAPKVFDLNGLLRSALAQRPDLMAFDSRIAAANESVRAARSGYLPFLSLSGGYGTSFSDQRQEFIFDDMNNIVGTQDIPFGDQFRDNRGGSVRLSLSIPIFDRFLTKNQVEQARVQLVNTELDRQNMQQTVALDVRQAYLDYETAIKRLDTTEKQLRAAEQALQVEQERYDVGASTLVELTQARARFVEAASGRAQAVYQFIFQDKVIEYYQGVLDPSQPLLR